MLLADSDEPLFRAGGMYLSAREYEALDRLLWAYIGTEEADPMLPELKHLKEKVEWRRVR